MLQIFLSPFKQATAGFRMTAWLHLGISKPSTSSSHLRLLHNSGRVTQGKTQVGDDLGLHHLGNPKASAISGQLQIMSEHHHPTPAQLTQHGGQRLEVSGHSQSLQLTSLGKSLPLICQQHQDHTTKTQSQSSST